MPVDAVSHVLELSCSLMPKRWIELKHSGRKLVSVPEGYNARAAARVKRWIQEDAADAEEVPSGTESERQVRSHQMWQCLHIRMHLMLQ